MRTFRAVGLLGLGVVVGIGATFGGNRTEAAPAVQEGRLEAGGVVSAGGQTFQFFRDTRTNTCYLASLSQMNVSTHRREVTALTQADMFSCTP
ncbi:MAG TPA: hypothetical protein VN700_08740 [Vicinamibacterales bacterium]|nr:hypothetical protein [Vicinamibacterales bacterium]